MIATRAAPSCRNRTATLTSVIKRKSAECTGLLATTTPSAPARINAAHTKKTRASATSGSPSALGALLVDVGLDVGERRNEIALTPFRWADAEAELTRPRHASLVGRLPGRRRRTYPRTRVVVFAADPQLPGHALRSTRVVDEQLVLRIDRVGA